MPESPGDITRTVVLDGGTQQMLLRRLVVRVLPASGPESTWPIAKRTLVIGTAADADIALDDPAVSRRHLRVEADRHGFRLTDLGSKNGTWLGGLRVESLWVAPGAELRVGATRLRFEAGEGDVEVRLSGRTRFGELIGTSPAMREVFALLERVAPTDLTVLVEGPSGTGKELVADALHRHSPRRERPFVVFDCSAVARDLIESALFGHVRGAFTGAVSARAGAFEEADGGTLFLDEIGELSAELQPKLLRALERREVRRVGSNDVVPVNVRVVAATNRDLRREVLSGAFREDLYYRLAVVPVRLPRLADRPEDVPLLVEHFLSAVRERTGLRALDVSWATMEKLRAHPWPGNVRELRNFVERAAALARGETLETAFLAAAPAVASPPAAPAPADALVPGYALPFKQAKDDLIDTFEREYWRRLLERTGGNVSAAAREAGVHRKSVEYILRKLRDGHDPADAERDASG